MLSSIRKFSTSIFAKILLGIIVIPFVFWGMGSSFNSGNKNVVVTIDDEKVSTQEFANFVRNQQKIDERITPEKIDQLLSAFIGDKLIEKEYEYYDIQLTNSSLSKLIKNQKEFKKGNKFSRTKYEEFLILNNLNAVSFEANISSQEKKRQLLNFIGGGIIPSSFIVNNIYDKINQKREIELIDLNKAYVNDLIFSSEDIKSYYDKNRDQYNDIFKTVKIMEVNPKKLIGSMEYNDIFFKKLDEIQDLIIQGEKISTIIKDYNLPGEKKYITNKLGQDQNYNKINDLSENLLKNIFKVSETEPTVFIENKDKFFIVEIEKTENRVKDLSNENVNKDIKGKLENNKKRKLMSEMISKINQNNFNKLDFDNFAKKKNINVQKIKLDNLNDNEILKEQVVNQIYAFPEKKVIIANDIFLEENFLIFIDKVVHTSVEQDSDEYSKYFNLSKVGLTNGLFNTYDDYIKNKYEININKKALTTVKSYFN